MDKPWRAIVVVVCVLVGGAALVACGSSSKGAALALDPAGSPAADPYTPSAVVSNVITFPSNVSAITSATRNGLRIDPKTHTRLAAGTAPGLYGGSGNTHVCDPQQIVAYLQQHADKAGAWAGVLGIAPADIASYVASLTPVVLMSDTLVTNHGFSNGRATSLQSVLQAGTAVMVDTTGTPRVKCNCGNPLAPPQPLNVATARTTGARWSSYSSNNVMTVHAGAPVHQFTLVNVQTGASYQQTAGSGQVWVAARDNPLAVGGTNTTTTITTSSDGVTWTNMSTIMGVVVTGLAYGNGTWIAVGTTGDPISPGAILQSTDLAHWTPVAHGLFHIDAVAYGSGRWVAVGGAVAGVAVGGVNHATRVAYTSTDATHWSQVELSSIENNASNMQTLSSVGYGDGKWLAAGINEQDDSTGATPSKLSLATFTSTDGTTWSPGAHWDSTLPVSRAGNGFDATAIAYGSGVWNLASALRSGGAALRSSPDATTWTDVGRTPFEQHPVEALAAGTGTWLAAALAGPESDTSLAGGPSNVYASTDGKLWKQTTTIASHVGALAYGDMPTTATPPVVTASAQCQEGPIWFGIQQSTQGADAPGLTRQLHYRCSGDWAYANYTTAGGTTRKIVLHWNSTKRLGEWEGAPTACSSNQVPADLATDACSNPPTTAPPATAPPTPASTNAGVPTCSRSAFQALLNARNPGEQVIEVWCQSPWAIVDTNGKTSGLSAWHFDGDIWNNAGQFDCPTQPSGLPRTLFLQVCQGTSP